MADAIDMLRVGPALPGMCPFYRDEAGGVGFDGQNSRLMDYGHTFDRERGYRVYFKFRDSAAANTWSAESLLKWLVFEPADVGQAQLQRIGRRLARQVIRLNREWERLGKPPHGISLEPAGRA